MGYTQLADFPLATGVNDGDMFYTDDVNTVTEQRTTAKQFSTYVLNGLAPQRQSVPVTANGQAVFITQGYMPSLINVFVAGFRLSLWQYQASDGQNVVITDPVILALIQIGMTVDIDACVSLSVADVATQAQVLALDPSQQPPIANVTGTEVFSARQAGGLFQTSFSVLAGYVLRTYNGFTQNGAGAVLRSIYAKLTDNPATPEDFGAKGDGVTNDTTAFLNALASFKSVRCTAGKKYMVGNLVVGAGQTLDLNGSTLAACAGANWIVKTTGIGAKLRNGQLDDTLNNTLAMTFVTVNAPPGSTVLQVTNGSAFQAGELVIVQLESGRPWISKVVSSTALSVTVLDTIPNSVVSATIVNGGVNYVVGDQLVAIGAGNVAPVLQVTSIGANGMITSVEVLDPGHSALAATNPVSFANGSGTGAQFNLAQYGTIVGCTVQSAQGLLLVDQAQWSDHDNLVITNAPVAMQIKNSLGATGLTTQNKFQGIRASGTSLCSLFLDVNVSVQHFLTCDFTAVPTTGAVGIYQEGRNSVTGTGNHNFSNVNVFQGCDGWVLKGPQLTDYIACVASGMVGTGWDIVSASGVGLRFTHCFAGSAANGVVLSNSPQVFFSQLWTKANSGYDFSLDANSTVWMEDQTWGPSRKLGGVGSYNKSQSFSLGGAAGYESLRVTPAGAGATNRWNMTGALTGNAPVLSLAGVDANPNGLIQNPGTGSISFQAGPANTTVMSYSAAGFTTFAPVIDGEAVFQAPATGFTITFGPTNSSFVLVPTSLLATGICALPQYPVNGQIAEISCSAFGVTAMTWTAQGAGATIVGAPAGLTAGRTVRFKYSSAWNQWVCIGS
jgi:hypothetical protein